MSEAIDKLYRGTQGMALDERQNSSTALFREVGKARKKSAERSKAAYLAERSKKANMADEGDEEEGAAGSFKMADSTTPGVRANRAGNPLGAGLPLGNSDPRAGHESKYNSERGGAFHGKYGKGG